MRLLAQLGILALVVAATSALWWLDALRPAAGPPEASPRARHEPDYYFDGFRLRAFDAPGAPRYDLHGQRLIHYADDASAEVIGPRLRYDRPDAPPWYVESATGTLSPGGDRVELVDDVVMRRPPAPPEGPVTVRTDRVTVFADAGRAETERPVTVTGPGWNVAAIGMTTWFESGLIKLHRDVRGRYDPTRAQ